MKQEIFTGRLVEAPTVPLAVSGGRTSLLATLVFLGINNIHSMNAFKAFLGSYVNGIAIIPFIFAGIIAWPQAVLMAVGGSLGGYLCAHYARRVEPHLIRRVVMIVAFSMTIYFFIYG